MRTRHFGEADGAEILEVALATASGTEARIITWGAVLRDLVVPTPSGPRRVVLGFDALSQYRGAPGYFGAIVGRYANRIGGARFALDGHGYDLEANENSNQLHGGSRGFGKRPWCLVAHDQASVTLALVSEDGDMGYPGRLIATCTYILSDPATLRIELAATTDRTTPVNLTTHTYYNLDGAHDVLGHRLMIDGEFVTPTDAALIPTGEVRAVAGTSYDFRQEQSVGSPEGTDYDINYVLRRKPGTSGLAHAARLASPASGIALDLWTTEPGLQFYDGHKIPRTLTGLDGAVYGHKSGLCLEPQRWPDGPNRSHFPPCLLHPGEVSSQVNEIRFSQVR
jgi:aldose 1-epimerase